jgi:hypothetical protein
MKKGSKQGEVGGGLEEAKEETKVKFAMAVKDQTKELDDPFDVRLDDKINPTTNDQYLIERLASAFLSETEICAIIKMPRSEFESNLAFTAAYQRGADIGKASLKRLQWKSAQANPVMQIWLGKQHLGQADKVEHSKGEDKSAAYRQFIDKLKNAINVTPTGVVDGQPLRDGEGSSPLLLAHVGSGQPDGTAEGRVAEIANHAGIDPNLEGEAKESREGIFRKLANVVANGGEGIRQDP